MALFDILRGKKPEGEQVFGDVIQPIGKKQVEAATVTLQRYKEGRTLFTARLQENERWYRLRHWESMRSSRKDMVEPTSAWLFNCLANKHADAMDNFPAPNILPREEGDRGEAKMLTSIVPVILEHNGFEKVFSDEQWYKLKSGTGCYGVFWDSTKMNGLGDVSIVKVDLLKLFWEPGVTDIQKSRNVFHVELMDNDLLIEQYPQLKDKLGASSIDVAQYATEENIDTSTKSAVIDWYYHRNGVLHYVKYVNSEVLFATENVPNYAEIGIYAHGKYPFVLDVLFPFENSAVGFGYIDIGKSVQTYIDRGDQALIQNMLANARPRYFIRNDGAVNEAEFADLTSDFVHVDGNLGEDSIKPIVSAGLPGVYANLQQAKIEELKETTGNRDVSTGGTASGVTAASAIAAMQEAGSKLSRDANKGTYRAFRDVIYIVIELIRQFYDLPRSFRIMGAAGTEEYVSYTNAGIAVNEDNGAFRMPIFDIDVTAEKQSAYSKMAQNELAIQFYQLGFFNPQMAEQSLACLDMMDFNGKERISQKIRENSALMQQMMMLAQMVDMQNGTNLSAEMGFAPTAPRGEIAESKSEEPKNVQNARKTAAESTSPV